MKSGFKISISKFMSKLNNTCNVIVTILTSVIKNNYTQKAKNVKKNWAKKNIGKLTLKVKSNFFFKFSTSFFGGMVLYPKFKKISKTVDFRQLWPELITDIVIIRLSGKTFMTSL